jgi:hypothetical protein
MTPQQAAAVQCGKVIPCAGASVPVDALFRSTAIKVSTDDPLQNSTGKVFYGFSGGIGVTRMLALWENDNVNFYAGRPLNSDPTSTFSVPLEK